MELLGTVPLLFQCLFEIFYRVGRALLYPRLHCSLPQRRCFASIIDIAEDPVFRRLKQLLKITRCGPSFYCSSLYLLCTLDVLFIETVFFQLKRVEFQSVHLAGFCLYFGRRFGFIEFGFSLQDHIASAREGVYGVNFLNEDIGWLFVPAAEDQMRSVVGGGSEGLFEWLFGRRVGVGEAWHL